MQSCEDKTSEQARVKNVTENEKDNLRSVSALSLSLSLSLSSYILFLFV